jgi:hypothetical protein
MALAVNSGLVFPVLVAGRLLLALTNLPDALKHDHQLSSPLTSYLNCAQPPPTRQFALTQ